MRRGISWGFIAVATLAALSQGSTAQSTLDGASSALQTPQTIVGAWWVDITPTVVPPFVSLGTFSGDGTLTNISSVSLSAPPESPGYGVWTERGDGGLPAPSSPWSGMASGTSPAPTRSARR